MKAFLQAYAVLIEAFRATISIKGKIMPKIITVLVLFLVILAGAGSFSKAEAVTKVRGYFKKSSGTYVMPHYRSNTDSRFYNNYSTKGNYNPYTGKAGTKAYRYSY
jgi:hypothetical protein